MKNSWIRNAFLTVVILCLLMGISFGSYFCYQMYEERQKTPDERQQIEQEKSKIAYQENLKDALAKKDAYEFIVVLNPAHGGKDTGNTNTYGMEKAITLSVCEQVIAQNTDPKIGIFLTRDDDVFMEKQQRLSFVEQLAPDMFVDVHVSKEVLTDSCGTRVYYSTAYYNSRLTNVEFADLMEKSVVASIEGCALGIFEEKREETQLIETLSLPAVSLVCGELSHPTEGILLTREPYQKNLALGILDGIGDAYEAMHSAAEKGKK